MPNDCRDLGIHAARYHTHVHRAGELRPDTMLKVLEKTDAFRRPERFAEFLLTCEADARGRTGLETRDYPQADKFRAAFAAAANVDNRELQAAGHEGAAFGEALKAARIAAISALGLREPSA